MKKVILVDGNNLVFRSYFATSYSGVIMRNSKGFPTNAVYGFINMINKIIEEEKPEYMLVAFDKGKTFRHKKYDFYKQGRNETPDELKMQFPKAKEVLDAMGIKHFEIDDYEADDIIGTISKMVDEEDEFIATIISSDKDLLQLISDEVDVKLLKQSDFIRMDKEKFIETYGVEPIRMIDIKALMGDSSDNIPGVKGVGEKTAIKYLSEYKSLDNLYEHIDEITGKIHDKLVDGKNDAYMSYEIATIYRDVPIDFTLESLKYTGMNNIMMKRILEELEFKSLLKKYNLNNIENIVKEEKINIVSKEEFDFNKPFSYYIETDHKGYSKGKVLGISFYNGENYTYITESDIANLKDVFENNTTKYTYDVKKSIIILKRYNIDIKNVEFDLMIASYLLELPSKDDIAETINTLGYDMPLYEEIYGTEKRKKEITEEKLKNILCKKVLPIYKERENIVNELKEQDEIELFENIEMPLSYVLADMEYVGIKVDKEYLDKIGTELKEKMNDLENEIYSLAGKEFNILSPKQLGIVLFADLKIPYPKKVKDNKFSTSKDILDKVANIHPIIEKVLEYRTVSKLYLNYAEGLKAEIREDGRIHTIFNQTLTRTGRLSSVAPNLQNIPVRDEYGRLIRKAFIPDENSVLLSSDYSQVELRIFADASGVEHLKEAFIEDKDIHTKTASDIYKVSESDVTKAMRRTAKAVNFGILYGISSFGLSEDLGIDFKEGKAFLDNYLNTYPGIKEYMNIVKKEAYEKGYAETLMNRKRKIPELESKNFMVRNMGERMALNTPIQGTAADILKKAMVEIFETFNTRNLKSKMLIQVHDELIFNVYNEELEEVKKIVKDIMENTYKLSVPLKVDIETGNNWYEAK